MINIKGGVLIVRDNKANRRRYLAQIEVNRMCMRYLSECKELVSYFETDKEREERLLKENARKEQEEREKNRHIIDLHRLLERCKKNNNIKEK